MTKKQYQRYSPEFKLHALKRGSEDGVTDKNIREELGMSRLPLFTRNLNERLLSERAATRLFCGNVSRIYFNFRS